MGGPHPPRAEGVAKALKPKGMADDIAAMPDGPSLYDRDFCAWTQEQAAALRAAAPAGSNTLDWGNLAEEIESLGKRERRELLGRFETIIEHLLRLATSPAAEPRAGWRSTVWRTRDEVGHLVADNPSLKPQLAELTELAHQMRRRVAEELTDRGESEAAAAVLALPAFTAEQVTGDWFPPPPAG